MNSGKEYVMRVTSKGQVTIPRAVRQLLGIRQNGRVAFRVRGKAVTIEPAEYSLESVYGAVPPLAEPHDFEEMGDIAFEEQAVRAVRGEQ